MENLFCDSSNLRNESDVEQFFVIRLLKSLGYEDKNIHTKEITETRRIGKGKDKKDYNPDYLIYVNKLPIIAIDVKNPMVNVDEGLKDAQLYAREINGDYTGENPIKYCIGTNGLMLKISKWDENKPFQTLNFEDFQFDNRDYNEFKTKLDEKNILDITDEQIIKNEFKLTKPEIGEIKGIFRTCHNKIWNNESCTPSFAFYEFVKLMFIKINEDKRIHNDKNLKEKIENGLPLPYEEVKFSLNWISDREKEDSNPVKYYTF